MHANLLKKYGSNEEASDTAWAAAAQVINDAARGRIGRESVSLFGSPHNYFDGSVETAMRKYERRTPDVLQLTPVSELRDQAANDDRKSGAPRWVAILVVALLLVGCAALIAGMVLSVIFGASLSSILFPLGATLLLISTLMADKVGRWKLSGHAP